MRSRKIWIAGTAAGLLIAGGSAHGQGVIVATNDSISATSVLSSFSFPPITFGESDFRPAFPNDGIGGEWELHTALNHSSATGNADVTWGVAYTPESPGVGGTWTSVAFSGSGSTTSSNSSGSFVSNSVNGIVDVVFDVPADSFWSLAAELSSSLTGNSAGQYAISLTRFELTYEPNPFDPDNPIAVRNTVATYMSQSGDMTQNDSFNTTLDLNGVLPAGTNYWLQVSVSSGEMYGSFGGGTSGSGEFTVAGGEFTLSAATTTCPADFNGDAVRDVADLFAYINAWLAKAAAADFNDDTAVDVADLFGFINAWLAGC